MALFTLRDAQEQIAQLNLNDAPLLGVNATAGPQEPPCKTKQAQNFILHDPQKEVKWYWGGSSYYHIGLCGGYYC